MVIIYAYTYVCVYTYVYVYKHTHTHTHTPMCFNWVNETMRSSGIKSEFLKS